MELEVYQAFTKAGVSEADAKAVAESINRTIDQRYALHAQSLATRVDLAEVGGSIREDMAKMETHRAEMETRLVRAISDMQRWTITAMFAGIATSAAIAKFFH